MNFCITCVVLNTFILIFDIRFAMNNRYNAGDNGNADLYYLKKKHNYNSSGKMYSKIK